MSESIPQIFKTPIVNAANDIFWQSAPGNLRNAEVLVLTRRFEQGSEAETQLMRMLDACKLTPERYQIVHLTESEQMSWNALREAVKPKFVMLFGVTPLQLGIVAALALHQINHFNDRIWMPTFAANELKDNAALKQHLWTQVYKPVFIG